jgi:hypothetical protein
MEFRNKEALYIAPQIKYSLPYERTASPSKMQTPQLGYSLPF